MGLQVELVSPEQVLYQGEASMVVCRTVDGGDIAFLPGHEAFLGALQIAKVRVIHDDGSEEVAAVHRGFVEVSHDRVIVLSDVAELAEHIDAPQAERRKAELLALIQQAPEDAELEEALARAELRLEVAAEAKRA